MVLKTALQGLLDVSDNDGETFDQAAEALCTAWCADGNWTGSAPDLKACLLKLRRKRAFRALERVCERIENTGYEASWLSAMHGQALVERGALQLALAMIRAARAQSVEERDAGQELDTWGQEGRVYKELYLAGSRRTPPVARSLQESLLRQSIESYHWAYLRSRSAQEAHYFGGNVIALCAMAARARIASPNVTPASRIAAAILDDVSARDAAAKAGNGPAPDFWNLASAAEASAHMKDWTSAYAWINRFLEQTSEEPFAIAATLRQFEQIWGASPNNPDEAAILTALRMGLIASEGGSLRLTPAQAASFSTEVNKTAAAFNTALPDGEFALQHEKVLGTEGPVSLKRINEIITCSQAVGRILVQTDWRGDTTIGTGFLIHGEMMDPRLKDQVLFLTNAHVLSPDPVRDQARFQPGEAVARFDSFPALGDVPLNTLVWCSPAREHDVSVFLLSPGLATFVSLRTAASCFRVADGLPKLKQTLNVRDKSGAVAKQVQPSKVYVIGYPLGQDLSFSLSDNTLVDYENVRVGQVPGPEPRRIHYRAPTEPGNSGSPVLNSRTLELIGIHHAGGDLAKLNGGLGTYLVNEGLWIRPVTHALRQALDRLAETAPDWLERMTTRQGN